VQKRDNAVARDVKPAAKDAKPAAAKPTVKRPLPQSDTETKHKKLKTTDVNVRPTAADVSKNAPAPRKAFAIKAAEAEKQTISKDHFLERNPPEKSSTQEPEEVEQSEEKEQDWDDLDKDDHSDPLMVSEYVNDIIDYLMELEVCVTHQK
ncbi:hypothetical protein HDU93_005368, partial [Gonapodya sp. JEL0774]